MTWYRNKCYCICSTHRELNERHGQQHREQDGQSYHHHHDVPLQVGVALQQLRVHFICKKTADRGLGHGVRRNDRVCVCVCTVYRLTVEGEVAEQSRNEVDEDAEAQTDVSDVLHPRLGGPERREGSLKMG